MNLDLIETITDNHSQFLSDESKSVGMAESISFPKSEEDIRKILYEINKQDLPITVQGARTGISGGAVPFGGHVMNLGKMDHITGLEYDQNKKMYLLSVQPGVSLSHLHKVLGELDFDTKEWQEESIQTLEKLKQDKTKYYFASDITETSASIGGMVACNASGARSYRYGAAREFVRELRLVLADGTVLRLKRGGQRASGRKFSLETESHEMISGELPIYEMPQVKNTAGYFVREDMELIDLFIGSEGTLGIITEIKISLSPKPHFIWGAMIFFLDEPEALDFVNAVRKLNTDTKPAALEYFNHDALDLFREQKESNATFKEIQDLKPEFHTAIYVEYNGSTRIELEELILGLGEPIKQFGGDEENTWLATTPMDLDKLIRFRHAIPESVNLLISQRKKVDASITKLGTDMAVPDCELANVIGYYNSSLADTNLESVMFGHIGDNHIHVNILPKNLDDYQRGKTLYLDWASHIVAMGGTVSAEHGIGKLKKELLSIMYGEQGIRQMKAIKSIFDPKGIINPGTIFS